MSGAVTVIIPTYNWSGALRLAISSVISQTYRDFEVLIVGDCCTDDSEEVVASFGDSRLQWHNLPVRHKTQSGPNNFAIEIASGRLIAYLGHDDIWHPNHLGLLIEKIDETHADIVCGACVMYGPPGSGLRAPSGVFPEGRYNGRDLLPPSSLMHRRDLTDRIGPWRKPEELAIPVDADLLERAMQAGARLESTERLTVFKFNSAWRRDSYLRRDTAEQQQILARLRADPGRCVEEEWAGLMRARREFRLLDATIPGQQESGPGERHHALLRIRGLERQEIGDLTEPRRFSLDDQDSSFDWYSVERTEEFGTFRWSGPSPSATLTLPVKIPLRFRVRAQLLNWLGANIADQVRLVVCEKSAELEFREAAFPVVILHAELSCEEAGAGPLRIQIVATRLRCLHLETAGANPNTRWLGVCVNWVEIEPLP